MMPTLEINKPEQENHMMLSGLIGLISVFVELVWLVGYAVTKRHIIPLEVALWFGGILSGLIVEVSFSAGRRAELLRFLNELVRGLNNPLKETRELLDKTRSIAKAAGSEIENSREYALQLLGELEVLPPMTEQAKALITVLQKIGMEVMNVDEKLSKLEQRLIEMNRSKFSPLQALVTVASGTVSTAVLSKQIQDLTKKVEKLQKNPLSSEDGSINNNNKNEKNNPPSPGPKDIGKEKLSKIK